MFSDRTPCTKLHKGEQKERTKILAEFPDHILNDYDQTLAPTLTFFSISTDLFEKLDQTLEIMFQRIFKFFEMR